MRLRIVHDMVFFRLSAVSIFFICDFRKLNLGFGLSSMVHEIVKDKIDTGNEIEVQKML